MILRTLIRRLFPQRETNAAPAPRGFHPGLWPVLRKGWKEPYDGVGGKHLPREKENRAEATQ